jgi:hypothetical protein
MTLKPGSADAMLCCFANSPTSINALAWGISEKQEIPTGGNII